MTWQQTYDPQSPSPGLNSGFVSCRYGLKAVTVQFDGHAQLLGWEDLQDSRRWSDRARSRDWRLGQR